MTPINTRSPQQWEIISKHIDFEGKTVIDLGCGYADLLFQCRKGGALSILGLDKDACIVQEIHIELARWEEARNTNFPIQFACRDIEDSLMYNQGEWDVSICFSVLPYLKDPDTVLKWMRDHSETALIECQFAGDGPGFGHIKNDADMEAWLKSIGWHSVKMIGRTLVEGRNKERSIWLCR